MRPCVMEVLACDSSLVSIRNWGAEEPHLLSAERGADTGRWVDFLSWGVFRTAPAPPAHGSACLHPTHLCWAPSGSGPTTS